MSALPSAENDSDIGNSPSVEKTCVSCCAATSQQHLTVGREGHAVDILEMATQFSFPVSCLGINEADDPARAACTTHGQSPAI